MNNNTAEGNRYKYVIMPREVANLPAPSCGDLNMQAGGLFDVIENAKELLDNTHASINKTNVVVTDVLGCIEKLEKILCLTSPDSCLVKNIVKRIESLLIMVLGLSQRSSLIEMLPDILQWINANLPCDTSMSQILYKYIYDLFVKGEENVTESSECKSNDDPDAWEELHVQAGWFQDNWETLMKGEFGNRLSGALNLLVAIGVMPEKAETIMGRDFYRMFKVKSVAFGGLSIFEHLASTLDWVVDSIWPALHTGDWSYLLTSRDEHNLDAMFRDCCNMVQLNTTGQFDKLKTKYGITDEVDIVEYIMLTTVAHGYFRNSHDKRLKQLVNVRLIQLDRFIVDIEASWHAAATREKPFAVLIRGPTSVGKSTIAGIVAHAINLTNGIKEGDQYTTTINGNDKYQSEFRTRHNTVIFDDMGNSKPERAEGNPLFILIQFINNMHCSALSPEAEKKGKNDIRCKTVIVTTNTADLHAWYFSVNPTSVLRRFDLIVDVAMKTGTRDAEGKILAKYACESQPDIWELTLRKIQVHNTGGLTDTHTEKVIVRGGVIELIEHLAEVTPTHFALQKQLVEASTRVFEKPHCDVFGHSMFTLPCVKCAKCTELIPHAGPFLEACDFSWAEDPKEKFFNLEAKEWAKRMLDDDPTYCWGPSEFDKLTLSHFYPLEQGMSFRQKTEIALAAVKGSVVETLQNVRTHLMKHHVEYKILVSTAGILSTLLVLRKVCSRPNMLEQGASLEEVKMHSIAPRMLAERDDKYQKVYREKFNTPNESVSTSVSSFESKLNKNMCIIKVQQIHEISRACEGPAKWCITTPISGGCWVVPWHMVSGISDNKSYIVDVCQKPDGVVGARRIRQMVNDANCKKIEGTDGCILDLPGGSTYAFDKFYTDDHSAVKVGLEVVMYRLTRATLDPILHVETPLGGESPISVKITFVGMISPIGVDPYFGVRYSLPFDSYPGLCGALIVLAGRNPVVLGYHTAGNGRVGAACLVTKSMLEYKKDLRIADTTEMPDLVMGRKVELHHNVHAHNAIHWIPVEEEVNIEVLGEHNLPTGTFRSDIIESPLVAQLETIGICKNHDGPQRQAVKMARHKDLLSITRLRAPYNPRILAWAVADFKLKIGSFMSECDAFKKHVHLISFEDALNGVVGVKGFDPININTSMGFPLNSPKFTFLQQSHLSGTFGSPTMKYVKEVVNEDGSVTYAYEIVFDASKMDIEAELNDLLAKCADHQRPNIIFRANLKDEALSYEKIGKGKIRVFAGAPVTLVIATRMLTLALVNAMSYFPTVFESAVGVDAAGRDWNRLYEFVTKFPHCCAGDFKSFDKVMPAGISEASFSILKFMLAECGIPVDFLNVMDTLATEISHPIYEVDGLLYRACGSTPSGHPLTVIKNGFDNALSMRYAYYASLYRDCPQDYDPNSSVVPLFHEVVALMTYGDDNIMSVDVTRAPLFDQLAIARELADVGQTYTSASKGEHYEKYTDVSDLDFLKRSFRLHEVFEKRVGALHESSIEKSLTCVKRPKKGQNESVAQILAGNLRQALFEYYLHGPKIFRKRREQFLEITKGVKDSEGCRIDLHFVPPTEEECIERYASSTCVYQKVMDEFLVPLSMQSGTWDDTPMIYSVVEPLFTMTFDAWLVYISIDWNVMRVHIQAKLNSWRTMRKRQYRVVEQYYRIVNDLLTGRDHELDFEWSVLSKCRVVQCNVRAVHVLQRCIILNQLQNLLNQDVIENIISYAKRDYYYRLIFYHEFGAVLVLTSTPPPRVTPDPGAYTSAYWETLEIESSYEV